MSGPSASWAPGSNVLVIEGPITPAAIPELCRRARGLLEHADVRLVICELSGVPVRDAASLEALARLQLLARRLGLQLRFRDTCGDLRDLVELSGLADALPCGEPSAVESRRQAEEREQSRGVEEEADPGDLAT